MSKKEKKIEKYFKNSECRRLLESSVPFSFSFLVFIKTHYKCIVPLKVIQVLYVQIIVLVKNVELIIFIYSFPYFGIDHQSETYHLNNLNHCTLGLACKN